MLSIPASAAPKPTYAMEYDGWIYYAHENGGLYKCKPDGKSKTKITDQAYGTFTIGGDRIYYQYGSASNAPLYTVKTDGTGNEMFCGQCVYYYFYEDEGILYHKSDSSYTSFRGSQANVDFPVAFNSLSLYVDEENNELYYGGSGYGAVKSRAKAGLYSLNPDGLGDKLIAEGDEVYIYDVVDGYIYYKANDPVNKGNTALYRVKPNGKFKKKLATGKYADYEHIGDGLICYSYSPEGSYRRGVYIMNIDKTYKPL